MFGAETGEAQAAGYDNEVLCRELKHSLGEEVRLADLQKQVLVPGFDLDNEATAPGERSWLPKLFHNLPGSDDGDRPVYRVAFYTSAAPIYFPSADGFVDGGLYASNPSMVALAHALGASAKAPAPTLQDHRVLSLGNGSAAKHIPGLWMCSMDWRRVIGSAQRCQRSDR